MDCSKVKETDEIIIDMEIYPVYRIDKKTFFVKTGEDSTIEITKAKGKIVGENEFVRIATKEEAKIMKRKKYILEELKNLFNKEKEKAFKTNIGVLEDIYYKIFKVSE